MTKVLEEHLRGLSGYNDRGEEIPDPRPVELPVDFQRPLSLNDQIRQMVRNEALQRELESKDVETFDEADDFEIEGEDMSSPWEERFDPEGHLTRELEERAGLVRITPEEIENARKVIADYDKRRNGRGNSGDGGSVKDAAGGGKVDAQRFEADGGDPGKPVA